MKITSAKVIVTCPGRNFVTLKILTDKGVYGLGDGTLNGRELAVVTYLQEYCIPCLIGRDPGNIEDIWQFLYRGAYWKRGPVTMTAIAAVDLALWDIKGKALDTPIYNLLGGKSRNKLLVYGHASGNNIDETVESTGQLLEKGYLAVRAQSGIPGVKDTYGVGRGTKNYEPAVGGEVPAEHSSWSTEKYLKFIPRLFEKLRDIYGDEPELLHDAHHRLTPIQAGRLGRDLEASRLFWLEDPVSDELQESFRIVRHHTVTPIAVGEVYNSVYDFNRLVSEQLIDYIRMPIVHGGGITPLLKTAAFASIYQIKMGFHGATDLSPVNMAASIHFNLFINNFGILEHMPHQHITYEVFQTNYGFNNGYLETDDSPGLGVDINEEAAAKYPYQKAFLPINRNTDGTIINW